MTPLLALVFAVFPQGATLPSQSTALAVSFGAGLVAGPCLLISVDEQEQGQTDLNGDGDAFDRVAHTVELDSGIVSNLAITGDWLVASDLIGVIEEYEGWQGIDLDGDGDVQDYVYRIHDLESGITRLLPWAVARGFFQSISIDRRRVSFLVSEADNGGADFNSDGDGDDLVAFVHDARSGATANLGVAARMTGVAGGMVAIAADEFGEGQDLDGNGLINGLVLFVLRSGALAFQNTQVPMLLPLSVGSLRVQRSAVLFETEEAIWPGGGADLNGDGDTADPVSVLWDVRARHVVNLGLAVEPSREALLTPEAVWVPVSEQFQGNQDLNGNGTALDQVLHRVALPSYASMNLGLAVVPGSFRASLGRCAFLVPEFQQGVDLNGDGDLNDQVMHIFEPAAGTVASTGMAGFFIGATALPSEGVGFLGVESDQGVDLNGDGDTSDNVNCFWDSATSQTRNLGLASASYFTRIDPSDRFMWMQASEASQGASDLNGDGDAFDQSVVYAYNPATGLLHNSKLAGIFLGERGRRAVVGVREWEQAALDRNGDGDTQDVVAARVGPLQ